MRFSGNMVSSSVMGITAYPWQVTQLQRVGSFTISKKSFIFNFHNGSKDTRLECYLHTCSKESAYLRKATPFSNTALQ